ncbi:MAG TPA: hypothetical protein VMU38_06280 [Candidatus Binatia bacterium]|nr:hypothetical protein [Candidatus Binatia bacterium]
MVRELPPPRLVISYGRLLFGLSAIFFGIIALRWHDAFTWQSLHQFWRVPFGTVVGNALMAAQIVGGAGLLFGRSARAAAVILGGVYSLFSIVCLPAIVAGPTAFDAYDGFFEQLSLLCGALAAYAGTLWPPSPALRLATRLGLGACTVTFTLAQAIYLGATAKLVPSWLPPNPTFWATVTTIAFGLTAVALLANYQARLASRLMSLMIAIFGLLVWVPLVFAHPSEHFNWSELALTFLIAGATQLVSDAMPE